MCVGVDIGYHVKEIGSFPACDGKAGTKRERGGNDKLPDSVGWRGHYTR